MANKKSYQKINKEAEVEEPIIKTEDTVVAEVEATVEEDNIIEQAAKYEVILATPLYFIINKDGNNITIKGLNNYKKGDMVSL